MSGAVVNRTVGFELGLVDDADRAFAGGVTSEKYVYTRRANPTVRACEHRMVEMEGSAWSIVAASGMAAIDIALSVFQNRDTDGIWLFPDDVYSGTRHYALEVLAGRRGIDVVVAECSEPAQRTEMFERKIRECRPSVVFFEPISNPLLSVVDGPAIVLAAKDVGATVVVDNTFASPHLCKPLEWGANLVLHSATKYLCGHNDTLAGVVSGNDFELRNRILEYRNLVGCVIGPDEAARLHSYSRTAEIRLRKQNSTTISVADFISNHPAVTEVRYPGLSNAGQREIAKKMFGNRGFGALLTFHVVDGLEGCQKFMKALNGRIPHIGTLGDIETSILHIESSFRNGFPTDAFRLSVGIEEPEAIISILSDALDTLNTTKKLSA